FRKNRKVVCQPRTRPLYWFTKALGIFLPIRQPGEGTIHGGHTLLCNPARDPEDPGRARAWPLRDGRRRFLRRGEGGGPERDHETPEVPELEGPRRRGARPSQVRLALPPRGGRRPGHGPADRLRGGSPRGGGRVPDQAVALHPGRPPGAVEGGQVR